MADGLRGDPGLWDILTAVPHSSYPGLADLASCRTGFYDLDWDLAVSYPHDLAPDDPPDEMFEGRYIPAGYLLVSSRLCEESDDPDPPDPEPILESVYRETLAAVLEWAGLPGHADRVRSVTG